MNTGDQIQGHACKADGIIYRSWHTIIESVNTDSIITISPAGSMVIDKTRLGDHPLKHPLRSFYWFDKFHNLIEVFDENDTLIQIYINIASLPEFTKGELRFKDHELDVVRDLPGTAGIIDEDEFAEAIVQSQYSEEFQKKMIQAAQEAFELANHWNAHPAPIFGGNDVK